MPPKEAHAELHQAGVADQKSHHQTSRNRQQKEPAKGLKGQAGEHDEEDGDGRDWIGKSSRPRYPVPKAIASPREPASGAASARKASLGHGMEKMDTRGRQKVPRRKREVSNVQSGF